MPSANGRSPHRERGLKFVNPRQLLGITFGSLPSQGAWIEIRWKLGTAHYIKSLPSQGAWIEIFLCNKVKDLRCRSPHRERGLKCNITKLITYSRKSLPSQGAWIEIFSVKSSACNTSSRSPHRERGLKFYILRFFLCHTAVAPLTGSVD